MNDVYKCLTLKVGDPEQIAIVLTNWASKGFCYKLSFPVYNKTFTGGNYFQKRS